MSVHVHVSAPGDMKCKATPTFQANYEYVDRLIFNTAKNVCVQTYSFQAFVYQSDETHF